MTSKLYPDQSGEKTLLFLIPVPTLKTFIADLNCPGENTFVEAGIGHDAGALKPRNQQATESWENNKHVQIPFVNIKP
jgi:hypothetical protein